MAMVIFSLSFQTQNCGQTFLGAGGGGTVECEGAGGVEGRSTVVWPLAWSPSAAGHA